MLGEELTAWLKTEMEENRNSKISKGKKYWEWLDEDGNPLSHDPRGASSFVSGPHYKLPVSSELCSSLKKEEEMKKEGEGDEKENETEAPSSSSNDS